MANKIGRGILFPTTISGEYIEFIIKMAITTSHRELLFMHEGKDFKINIKSSLG
jgi:hypothetical protein